MSKAKEVYLVAKAAAEDRRQRVREIAEEHYNRRVLSSIFIESQAGQFEYLVKPSAAPELRGAELLAYLERIKELANDDGFETRDVLVSADMPVSVGSFKEAVVGLRILWSKP